MICNNYKQVYEYYARVAYFYMDSRLRILKTDAHNESKNWDDSIPLAPILDIGNDLKCVEIDEDTLSRARRNFPDIDFKAGDIRNLDSVDQFDLLLDFSTIDHVAEDEYPSVLKNYKAAANLISVVVWLSDARPSTEAQKYFNNFRFRRNFYETIGEFREVLLYVENEASLVHFMNVSSRSNRNIPNFLEVVDLEKLHAENEIRSGSFLRSLLKKAANQWLPWKLTEQLRSVEKRLRKLGNSRGIKKTSRTKFDSDDYHWRYLDSQNYRYEEVSKIVDFRGRHVVDLCSGNTGLYELVKDKVASYQACDVVKIHPIVQRATDSEFAQAVKNCDILCAFGHGGFEISKEGLESKTLTDSLHYLMKKFKPQVVVLESIARYFPIIADFAAQYDYGRQLIVHKGNDWLDNRAMLILRKHVAAEVGRKFSRNRKKRKAAAIAPDQNT